MDQCKQVPRFPQQCSFRQTERLLPNLLKVRSKQSGAQETFLAAVLIRNVFVRASYDFSAMALYMPAGPTRWQNWLSTDAMPYAGTMPLFVDNIFATHSVEE